MSSRDIREQSRALISTAEGCSWVSAVPRIAAVVLYSSVISADRLAVTCSTDLTIKLWDTSNDYTNVKTLHGHDHSVSSVSFTPDGDMLVSASRDKTIRVWEVASG